MNKFMIMSLVAASLMTASCNCGAKKDGESKCETKKECCAEGKATLDLAMLSGSFNVVKIEGNDVKTENPVTMEFNADNKVHANLGCNIMNTSYEADAKTGAFKFADNGQRTMMMCPDMATEDALVKAMQEVVSASTCEKGIALKNSKGDVIIALKK